MALHMPLVIEQNFGYRIACQCLRAAHMQLEFGGFDPMLGELFFRTIKDKVSAFFLELWDVMQYFP